MLAGRGALRRWALALSFHVGHLLGRAVAMVLGNAPATLVIRTDGIGDALLFEPALRSLRQTLAGRRLQLWAPDTTCELFDAHPCIAVRRSVPRGGKNGNLEYFNSFLWRAAMGWRLGRGQFDAAIYAVHSPEPLGNWLLASARAAEKWYASGDTENQFGWQQERTVAVATRRLHSRRDGHELQRNSELARQWGAGVAGVTPSVWVGPEARAKSESELRLWQRTAHALGATGFIGLMPGSAMPSKAYPASAWAQVARGVWEGHGALCALFGGRGDADRLAQIESLMHDVPHLRVSPHTDLLTAAALLPHLMALVSIDTGLAHLAVAQDVPTVVLCNGGHPGRFFPWPMATKAVVLNHPMPCDGCRCRCKLKQPECITRITPGEILAAMRQLVGGRIPLRVAA